MMIKGSLLCSIPIVKRFRAKFSVRNRAENWWFWRGKILTPTLRPLGNQPHRNTLSGAKTVLDPLKMWSPEAGKKSYKNKNNQNNPN